MSPGRVTTAFERLEPCAVKAASTVLRGRGGSNVALLPDWTLTAWSDDWRKTHQREEGRGARVFRGGGYYNDPQDALLGQRDGLNVPHYWNYNNGFRVVVRAYSYP